MPAPAWLPSTLACPFDAGPIAAESQTLRCTICGARFPLSDGIAVMAQDQALTASGSTQRSVYDSRNRSVSVHAQRQGFALQLVYRRHLLLDALRALDIGTPSGDDIWAYIGGGEATQCMVLSAFGGRHVSFDVSLTQLELGGWLLTDIARLLIPGLRADRIAFVCGDGEGTLPFRSDATAVAYGLGVLNHLQPDSWVSHLSELSRIVRPGGHVFHVVPNLACEVFSRDIFSRQFTDPSSMQYWTQFVTEPRVRAAFAAAGLQDIRCVPLWRLDHDSSAQWLRRPEAALARLAVKAGVTYSYPLARAAQERLRVAADKEQHWARPWTFQTPRHLAIAGRVPLTA